MRRIKVGIAGGTGYTGGELIRLLVNHPYAEIICVQGRSAAGKFVYEVHPDLLGETDLTFSATMAQDLDVLFLCLPHGESKPYLVNNKIGDEVKVIDLGQDFRYNPENNFVYGLTEWNRHAISSSSRVANPGCFATAIQLALLPLLKSKQMGDEVHVTATTGATGAGTSLSGTSHFSWRNNNHSTYKPFTHQHLHEIQHSVRQHGNQELNISFIPQRGNFSRGIHVSMYTNCDLPSEDIKNLYHSAYDKSHFVHVSGNPVDVKQVVNTNKCFLHIEKHGNKVLVTSVIDNLLKGAAGQALQNMNILCGFEETAGLKLKSIAY
jgi:N-acetyl-gamma-glutamyl-phosphate reductase